MTPSEFRTIRDKLNLTQAALAPMLGYSNPIRVSELETGLRPVPDHIARLMLCYAVISAGLGKDFIPDYPRIS